MSHNGLRIGSQTGLRIGSHGRTDGQNELTERLLTAVYQDTAVDADARIEDSAIGEQP